MTALFLTSEQSRAVDRYAIDRLGMPGLLLMENAGRGATDRILDLAASLPPHPFFAIFTGSGNNAGDGFVVARHLACRGHDPLLIRATPPERLSGDARIMSDICIHLNLPTRLAFTPRHWHNAWLPTHRPLILIDALMGTGARGAARPHFADLIRHCNRLRQQPHALTVALDLPSGLDVDTGEPSDPTIHADFTLTFCAMKIGFSRPACALYTGRMEVIPIGIPEHAVRASLTNPPTA